MSRAESILKTALYLAVDWLDADGHEGLALVEHAARGLDVDWLVTFTNNDCPERITVRRWLNGETIATTVLTSNVQAVLDWAATERLARDIPFDNSFIPSGADNVIFISDYRDEAYWGVAGFGRKRAWTPTEISATADLTKVLCAAVRRQEVESNFRKDIKDGCSRLRNMVPV